MIRILVDIHYKDSKKRPCFRRSLTFFEDGDLELALGHVKRHASSPKIVWEHHDGPVPQQQNVRIRRG